MKIFLNYLGQARIYSLVDLILLLLATHASTGKLWGAILLWLGFLALLESQHHHSYRAKVPAMLWVILFAAGVTLYGWIPGLIFVAASVFYTLKDKKFWGATSPLFRGFQSYVLVGGISGYSAGLAMIAGILTLIRNLLGDVRDAGKDSKEGTKTIPVLLGQKKNTKHIHLAGVVLTSLVWWYLGGLSVWLLIVAIVIEVTSYNLTPRS